MSDLRIVRTKHIAYIYALSPRGLKWLEASMVGLTQNSAVTIQIEYLPDILEIIKDSKLEYEER